MGLIWFKIVIFVVTKMHCLSIAAHFFFVENRYPFKRPCCTYHGEGIAVAIIVVMVRSSFLLLFDVLLAKRVFSLWNGGPFFPLKNHPSIHQPFQAI